ncbi:hypothetical protein BKA70DRAFT_1400685 [Coprinopsis sp. MPI-PUGE-AT-0042]|nr:hypothetical protein BKA70DRAFT_1400685 [Coprinopsis sp. MPI-PUGE-AT-0042]
MLGGATTVVLSGEHFSEVGRDQINVTNLSQVFLLQPGLFTTGAMIPSPNTRERYQHPLRVELVVEPDPFTQVELLLQTINHLLASSPTKLSSSLRKNVCELSATVAFCKRAYFASRMTSISSLLRRDILKRMAQCATTLLRVHGRITKLPYPSIPLASWKNVGQLILAWLANNGQEPEDILSIRIEVIGEIEALGDYLGFAWANGSPSLRSLRVEEIIVIEPLGRALSVPLRFVDSSEDIHQFVRLGCHGTKGYAFIEGRQYQLDDSITNKPISAVDSSHYLSHGTVLEVSIVAQAVGMTLTDCPRCGDTNDQGEARNGWIQCHGCRMLFNATESVSTSRLQGSAPIHGPPYSSTERPDASSETENSEDPQNSLLIAYNLARYIFRRIKLEVLANIIPTPSTLSVSNTEAAEQAQSTGTLEIHNLPALPSSSQRNQQQSPPPPIVISDTTGQALVPTFSPQTPTWEDREPCSQGSPSGNRSSRRSRKPERGWSFPPGLSLGQMLPGVGYAYPESSDTPHSLSPGLCPYSAGQSTTSAMYVPSGHPSTALVQHDLPHSAPIPRTSLRAQQQQAAQARSQPLQQHARGTVSPPTLPFMMGAPNLVKERSSHGCDTTQLCATVVVKWKRNEKSYGSSFFGRLTSCGRKKRETFIYIGSLATMITGLRGIPIYITHILWNGTSAIYANQRPQRRVHETNDAVTLAVHLACCLDRFYASKKQITIGSGI